METGIQDQGLSGYHETPADAGEGEGDRRRQLHVVVHEQEDGVRQHSRDGGQQQAPEVEALILAECHEDEQDELQAVVDRNREDGRVERAQGLRPVAEELRAEVIEHGKCRVMVLK